MFSFDGTVDSFGAAAQSSFKYNLSQVLAVDPTGIKLDVTAASINVEVTIIVADVAAGAAVASNLETSKSDLTSLASQLGVTGLVSVTPAIVDIVAYEAPSPPPPSPPPPSPPPSPPPIAAANNRLQCHHPSPPPSPPPPSIPPTPMARALTRLYDTTGGSAWHNNSKWLTGEPCVDRWFGVHCCPRSLPILSLTSDGTEMCSPEDATTNTNSSLITLISPGNISCSSGFNTGTIADVATCVVTKVLLPHNNLVGTLEAVDPLSFEHALCGLPFLQHLDLSGNALSGLLPGASECMPRLTRLNLTQSRYWYEPGGFTGTIPGWLLARTRTRLTDLHMSNNGFDDPETVESEAIILTLWKRCSEPTVQCSGVPPKGCSAFNREGYQYEVALNSLECARCPGPVEIGLWTTVAVLLYGFAIASLATFMWHFRMYAQTHVASVMILVCSNA